MTNENIDKVKCLGWQLLEIAKKENIELAWITVSPKDNYISIRSDKEFNLWRADWEKDWYFKYDSEETADGEE